MANTLITAQTAGATSDRFEVKLSDLPITLSAPGLATTEVVDLHISTDGGSTYAATGAQLTASENTKPINTVGIFKAVKSATAASVGVFTMFNNNL